MRKTSGLGRGTNLSRCQRQDVVWTVHSRPPFHSHALKPEEPKQGVTHQGNPTSLGRRAEEDDAQLAFDHIVDVLLRRSPSGLAHRSFVVVQSRQMYQAVQVWFDLVLKTNGETWLLRGCIQAANVSRGQQPKRSTYARHLRAAESASSSTR
jgi:hypothetical protein